MTWHPAGRFFLCVFADLRIGLWLLVAFGLGSLLRTGFPRSRELIFKLGLEWGHRFVFKEVCTLGGSVTGRQGGRARSTPPLGWEMLKRTPRC